MESDTGLVAMRVKDMTNSLRTKLSLSYIFLALISILLISILTNVFVEKHFKEYVKQNQEQKNRELVTTLAGQYLGNNNWNIDVIESIGVSALENGTILRVKDINGNIVWDANEHNNGMCQRIIEHMARNTNSRYGHEAGSYTEVPYPINYKLNKVGVAEIGTYGPYYLSDHDLAFINALNNVLAGVGVFSLISALLLGTLMARKISSPISRVIATAKSISNGLFSDRINERSNTTEINQLTTTINNLAEAMENQESLRKRLTGDVAHELRTPLATLQSHMEAMIDGIWQADTDRLKSCHEEIVRISKMVGDLEKLAQYESENLVLSKETFDITDLIRRLIQNFELEYLNKELYIEFSGKSEEIHADKDKLSQVIVNLLSNALKYTQKGGKVNISVQSDERYIQLIVKDNGPGIPEHDLPYIFERFYRADKSRNRLTGGSGIGLTISRAIVVAHGGSIQVKSTLGNGTEFIVLIPKQK